MIKKIIPFIIIAAIIYSCNSASKENPVTDTDVATTFIRATLDNDFKTAEKFLLNDTENKQYLETFERRGGVSTDKAEQEKYKAANIIIDSISKVNDSTKIVTYTNSYKKDHSTNLKLVWVNGKWMVDLKYTFTGK